ncbi:hypothetical protein D3C75_516920 [compost metagenome]
MSTENNNQLIFDEEQCAEFIFNKLIAEGVAVSIEDIHTIMDLEYEYGRHIGIYPSKDEDGNREPLQVSDLIIIRNVDGQKQLHTDVSSDEAIELLQEAIDTIKAFD